MSRKFSIANLRANWYLPLSALILFVMQSEFKVIPYGGVIAAFVSWVIFCGYVSPSGLWKTSAESGLCVKVYSWLTALGVCVFSHTYLYERMLLRRDLFDKLLGLVHIPENVFYYLLFAVSLCSLIFVYLCVNYFWEKFLRLIRSNGVFHDIGRAEIFFYFLLFAATVLFVTASFIKSDVFYGAKINFDTIYSSDTGSLLERNSFINIDHGENDIRQPLFAVFSIPFIGVPYLAGRIIALFFGHRELLTALFMNYAQIAMLIAGICVLTKTLRLSPLHRIIFTLCFSCSYVYLLAVLMIEQYIVVFFWLSLCVCFVCSDSEPDRMLLYGTGGTLITGFIFTPFYLHGWGGQIT